MKVLVPRLDATQAVERFTQVQELVRNGTPPSQLARLELGGAVPNATGGRAPTLQDVSTWRTGVQSQLQGMDADGFHSQAVYSRELGRALEEVIQPSRSDAAHDGVWAYLSLMVFPDLVARRWGPAADGSLSADRWIGAQVGRDRNYLKLSWRNWTILGEVMQEADPPLGEDEFVALLERTALARNLRLIRLAAKEIIGLDRSNGIARTAFARELMKRLTFHTGPVVLDLLHEEELAALVRAQAREVVSAQAGPRRSLPD